MKNNIESNRVHNRKIIVELRFNPIPKFLDLKGTLISEIEKLKIISGSHWGIGDSAIKIADSDVDKLERNRIHVEINRLSFVSTNINSISDFYSKFEKIHKTVKECLGDMVITRIGCRIQGTYSTKSTNFNDILNNFKQAFPSTLFLENFPVNDLRFQLNYQNGNYHIGPIKKDDTFLKGAFPYPECKNEIGIGIDTDNFLLKTTTEKLDSISKIKDVFMASLAVEKTLVENLRDF